MITGGQGHLADLRCLVLPTTKEQLAGCIDYALLDSLATRGDVETHCRQAVSYGFCAVCVLPRWTALAADILHGSKVKVAGMVGFPSGADSSEIKALQAKELIMAGADEIDMVADLTSITETDGRSLGRDMAAVLRQCRIMRPAVTLKVIIESAALTDEQIVFACNIAAQAGVDFVKTDTGLLPGAGATVQAVELMARSAPNCRIKAAGGITTAQQAMDMLAAGASRIGTSAAVQIVDSFNGEGPEK